MTPFYRFLRYVTAGVCAYEAAAILIETERTPTLSMLAHRHRWIAPLLISALSIHLAMLEEAPCTRS